MSNVRRLNFQKIYLFDKELSSTSEHNPLKEFLFFLKFMGKRGNINFAYASNIDSIHKGLTIIDNFLLDAVPMTLVKEDEELKYFGKILEQIDNPALFELIDLIGDLGETVKNLSPQKIKLVTMVKAILSSSDYLFFVSPEEHLSLENIKLVKLCIEYEALKKNRHILIKSNCNEIWIDIATNTISQLERGHYILNPNALNKPIEQSGNLSEIKQAS